MNYSADKPIESSEQDLLGRTTFSKQLGEAIYKYDGKDGLVIGVFGKWGSGKTSVLNMVVKEINQLSENDDDSPIIVNFAPWNYSDKDNLISIFFDDMRKKIKFSSNNENMKQVVKAIDQYSGVLNLLSYTSVVLSQNWIIMLKYPLKCLYQYIRGKILEDTNLDKAKTNLERELIKSKQKIIVIIDDIDRLTNTQIRDIFQLVKQVGNFPNIIYVLSMDRDVVCRALESVHNIDGSEYLEKIVQIPFEIPALMKSKLREIFLIKLKNTLKTISVTAEIDSFYWSNVITNCVIPYIKTLRDVNRVINTFQFRYKILFEETSFEDMVALTTIEVLEPQLYQWIGRNRQLLCSKSRLSLSDILRDQSDYRASICEELKGLGINTDIGIKFLSTIFPVFADDIGERNYSYPERKIRGTMRVAQEERFDSYFIFDLDGLPVSRYIINNCINKLEFNDLKSIITKINNEGKLEYFIDELQSLVDTIPYERLALLATVLLYEQHKFPNDRSFYMFPTDDKAESLVYDILDRINNENERYYLIKNVLDNINKEQLGTIAEYINKIKLSHRRLAENDANKEKQFISLEHLKDIEVIYVTKINEIAQSQSILDVRKFLIAFDLWESFDKDRARAYLKNILRDNINVLKYICAIAYDGISSDGDICWYFPSDKYLTYISKEIIYKIVQEFDKQQLDDIFTLEDQIKLASFVLNYESSNHHNVSEEEAKKLVNDWINQ